MRRAKGLGRIVRGDVASRGGSGDCDGSGASSHRGRLALLSLAGLVLAGLILLVASAFASKEVVNYIGAESGSGSKGGEFWSPRDSAINATGAGPANAGDIYVADELNNRVQRFNAEGNFISAWGADVIEAGNPGDVAGTNPYEICTVAADCQRGAESGGNGAVSGNGALNRPQSLAVDEDTGNVYVADRLNNRVNEYTGDGTFIRSFGFGVDETNAGEGYEVCPATDICKAGLTGSGTGQIGETGFFGAGLGIAVSPADGNAATGTVFVADTANRRVNTYALDGTNPSSFGSEAQFGESQPRKVAVDSRGIVYASNSANGGEIERYDSENANGDGVGFLAPIASPPLLEGFAEGATAGLAVDPDSDGAGPDQDVLYVLRRSSATFHAVVQQFGPLNDPGLTAPPTAVDDTHGAGAEFSSNSTGGLGVDSASGRLYVSTENAAGQSAARVYILDEAPAPTASIDPVTSFDAHSATFSGEVDPNGAFSGYHFEYVDDAEFQANGFTNAQRYPLSDVGVGRGENPVAVETEIPHHLVAGTTYHVHLVAKRTYGTAENASSAVTFTTPASAPSIDGTEATVGGVDSATLRGTIDPEGQAVTDYHFEWGATNAYGNSTPAGNLPSGSAPVPVEAELEGLAAGQTYHYRLVATNATGTTQGPDQSFTTPAGPPHLPQRGYEIASQYPTGGFPMYGFTGQARLSEDGNRMAVGTTGQLPQGTIPPLPDEPPSGLGQSQYLFERGPDSWQHITDVGLTGFSWSADLNSFEVETATQVPGSNFNYEDSRMDPDDRNGMSDVYQWQPGGKLTWISRDPRISVGTPQTAPGNAQLALPNSDGAFALSADGHTVVFKSQRQLLDADTTPESGVGAPFRLYKWEDGQLSFVGARPDGSVPASGSKLGDNHRSSGRYAVSRDGSRVIFSALRRDDEGSQGEALYVQSDGQPTLEATKEEGVAPLPADQPNNVTYRGAAADDSRVFFTSASRFTPDSGAGAENGSATDLYAYDVATNKLRDLTPRLDGLEDPSVDPAGGDEARVLGVAANSEDGKRVYFVAEGAYPTAPNPEGELPSASGRNLYMAELDSIDGPIKLRFIAMLGSEDGGVWQAAWSDENGPGNVNIGKTALASADGSVLGFASTESLTGQPLGGTEQLFVYNAGTGTLACASCPGDGSLPADTVNRFTFGFEQYVAMWQEVGGVNHWVSDDGTVFFSTVTALLPADQNTVTDVYEFRDGKLGLITPGTGTKNSLLDNVNPDGSTVLFNTQEALAPQDKEPGIPKIYAARVGGGFPYAPPPAPCDFNAGACEGAPSSAPETPGAGTAAFEGPGNPKPRHHRRKRHHHRTAKHNRRASR
jgi:hypothetical protein